MKGLGQQAWFDTFLYAANRGCLTDEVRGVSVRTRLFNRRGSQSMTQRFVERVFLRNSTVKKLKPGPETFTENRPPGRNRKNKAGLVIWPVYKFSISSTDRPVTSDIKLVSRPFSFI